MQAASKSFKVGDRVTAPSGIVGVWGAVVVSANANRAGSAEVVKIRINNPKYKSMHGRTMIYPSDKLKHI